MKYLNKKVKVKTGSGTISGVVTSETNDKIIVQYNTGTSHIIAKVNSIITIIEVATNLLVTLSSFWKSIKSIFKKEKK